MGAMIIAVAIVVVLAIWNGHNDGIGFAGFMGGVAMLLIFIGTNELSPDITPMDVYQGKTTLKYEVVDGVKVDSTVVWKEEK